MKNTLLSSVSHSAIQHHWRLRGEPRATPEPILHFRMQRWAHRSALLMLDDIIAGRTSHTILENLPTHHADGDGNITYDCNVTLSTHLPESTPALYHDAITLLCKSINAVAARHSLDTNAPAFCISETGRAPEQRESGPTSYAHFHRIRFRDTFDVRLIEEFLSQHKHEIMAALRTAHHEAAHTSPSLQ